MEKIEITLNEKRRQKNKAKAVEKDPLSVDMEALLKDEIQTYTRRIGTAKESCLKGILNKLT